MAGDNEVAYCVAFMFAVQVITPSRYIPGILHRANVLLYFDVVQYRLTFPTTLRVIALEMMQMSVK